MEYFSNKFIDLVTKNKKMDELTIKKVKYGVEVLFINITKLAVVLIIAKILGTFVDTMELIIVIALIRLHSFGVHARTSFQCTIVSLIMFIGPVELSRYISFDNFSLVVLFIVGILLLYMYAPADTEKRPLKSLKKRKIMKIKALSTTAILFIISFIFGIYSIKVIVSLGGIIAALMTTPVMYKILGQKYRNYERC